MRSMITANGRGACGATSSREGTSCWVTRSIMAVVVRSSKVSRPLSMWKKVTPSE